MPRPQNFITMMPSDDVRRLESFVREQYRTLDATVDYLIAEFGFVNSEEFPDHPRAISRSAVHRWKKKFEAEDQLSAASELSNAIFEAATKHGTAKVIDSAALKLSQVAFDRTMQLDELSDTLDIRRLSSTLRELVRTKDSVDELLAKQNAEKKAKLEEVMGQAAKQGDLFTPENIAKVSKAVFG